jgi:flagellin
LGRKILIGGSPDIAQMGLDNGVSQEAFLSLSSIDGSAFTISSGDTSQTSDTDITQLHALGLMSGTFGGGDSGTAYEMTGRHIQYGTNGTSLTGTPITALNDFTVNGVQIGSTSTDVADTALSASTYRDAINSVSSTTGVTATATNEVFIQFDVSSTVAGASSITGADTITVNGVQFSGTDATTTNFGTATTGAAFTALADTINTKMAEIGSDVRAEVTNGNANSGNIRLFSASGSNISFASAEVEVISIERADGENLTINGTAYAASTTAATFGGQLTFSSESGPIVFGVADDSTTVLVNAGDTLADAFGVNLTGTVGAGGSTSGLDVSSATASSSSLASVDSAIDAISSMRSDLGALQNRLGHTISNLMATSENHEASRSLIEDADYAQESAALAKAQVLAQASAAMLSQANASPQLALQLIQ